MKFTWISVALGLLLLVAACSKEQRTINRLEGDWQVVAFKKNGADLPDSLYKELFFSFRACKAKDFDYCDGAMTRVTAAGTRVTDFKYSIGDNGKDFLIEYVSLTLEPTKGVIKRQTRKQLVWEYTNSRNELHEMTFAKF